MSYEKIKPILILFSVEIEYRLTWVEIIIEHLLRGSFAGTGHNSCIYNPRDFEGSVFLSHMTIRTYVSDAILCAYSDIANNTRRFLITVFSVIDLQC